MSPAVMIHHSATMMYCMATIQTSSAVMMHCIVTIQMPAHQMTAMQMPAHHPKGINTLSNLTSPPRNQACSPRSIFQNSCPLLPQHQTQSLLTHMQNYGQILYCRWHRDSMMGELTRISSLSILISK